MKFIYWKLAMRLALVAMGLSAFQVAMAESGVTAHNTLGGRFSGDVQEYFADILLEPWHFDKGTVLLDLRGTGIDSSEQEVNAGLVWRGLCLQDKLILGLNGYYDHRWTEEDNSFGQVGGGIELLSRVLDLRANYYYPLDDEELLSSSGGFEQFEEALEGYDAEAVIWMPFLAKHIPTGVFVGYYDFSSDIDEDLSGLRVRLESRLHPRITFDAEWFEDDELNDTDYFVGFRIHVPLGSLSEGRERTRASSFESRLYDMVNRDFRIRTIETAPNPIVNEPVALQQRSPEDPEKKRPICTLDSEGEVVCN
jgi:hypothetical protein